MTSVDSNTNNGSIADQQRVAVAPTAEKKNPPKRRGILMNLVVESADKVAQHLGKATGAREYFRAPDDKGKILHLALDVDDVAIYLEELGHCTYKGAEKAHARLHLYMDDPADKAEQLMKAGAKTVSKLEKQFWGATYGVYEDPFGVVWSVSNAGYGQLEDMPEELENTLVPFVMVTDAAAYLKFLKAVFGAEPVMAPAKSPNGKIMWAELNVNGGKLAVADLSDGGESTVTITYQVPSGQAEAVCNAFETDGGEILEVPSTQFWGQVWGRCKDAFGQAWGVCEPQSGDTPTREEMAVDIRLAEKYKRKWSWKIEDVPTAYCFGEVRTTATELEILKETMHDMIPKAHAEAAKCGISSVGPPLSGYYTWDSKGTARLTTGPMVAKPSHSSSEELDDGGADGGFAIRAVGGVKCATVLHVGPYYDLMSAYEALGEWIAAKGYETRMPFSEIYENDPKDTEESKLRTKIWMPVVKKDAA